MNKNQQEHLKNETIKRKEEFIMDFEKTNCPVVKINGVIERGKQYDLDITLPEDNRNVIYGIVKDCYKDPVCDAVVKLIEVECKMGKDIRKPVSHTFTDENGEFVFGPLCDNRVYEVEIWVNKVKPVSYTHLTLPTIA